MKLLCQEVSLVINQSLIGFWEFRSLEFTATQCEHTLKFLPGDDDDFHNNSDGFGIGGVRMGIDSIYINKVEDYSYFGDEVSICPNQKITLNPSASGINSIKWSNGLDTKNLIVDTFGIYTFEITTNCGTIIYDTIRVSEKKSNCKCNLFFPNAFTPNNDGNNDTFSPLGKCNYNSFDLKIFNRWGAIIYSTNSTDGAWDGMVNNQYAPIGTYYFVFKYKNNHNESYSEVGQVTIIR